MQRQSARSRSKSDFEHIQALAERVVLVPIGAGLLARDSIVGKLSELAGTFRTRSGAERQIRRYEQRATLARARAERSIQRAQKELERELKRRRSVLDRELERSRVRFEQEVAAFRKHVEKAAKEVTSPPSETKELSDQELSDWITRMLETRLAEVDRTITSSSEPDIAAIFAAEITELLGDVDPDPELVRRAVRQAAAEQAWVQRLGTLLDSKSVEGTLGVSRQRVSHLAREHRLVVVPKSDDGFQFPAWQFAGTSARDRHALAQAQQALIDEGRLSPWSATSWLVADHADLDGKSALEYLREGGDPAEVLVVANRDAARLAQ